MNRSPLTQLIVVASLAALLILAVWAFLPTKAPQPVLKSDGPVKPLSVADSAEQLLEQRSDLEQAHRILQTAYLREPRAFEADSELMKLWKQVCDGLGRSASTQEK